MKIKNLKLANSIRIGNQEEVFIKGADFDIELEMPVFTITHRRSGMSSKTTVYNAIYWVDEINEANEAEAAEAKSKGSTLDLVKRDRSPRASGK